MLLGTEAKGDFVMLENFSRSWQGIILAFAALGLAIACLCVVWVIRSTTMRLVRWWPRACKVRCPQCQGTGICLNDDGKMAGMGLGAPGPHSCCGDCGRTRVPVLYVTAPYTYALSDDNTVIVGVGWVPGSPWQRLRRGGPRKQLGVLP